MAPISLGQEKQLSAARNDIENGVASFPRIEIAGVVRDPEGEPAPNVVVRMASPIQKIDTRTSSDAAGRFAFNVHIDADKIFYVPLQAENADRSLMGVFRFPFQTDDQQQTLRDKIQLQVEPTKVTRLRVVDAMDLPIEGASAVLQRQHLVGRSEVQSTDNDGMAAFRLPESEPVVAAVAWKSKAGLDYQLYRPIESQENDKRFAAPEFSFDDPTTLRLEGAMPVIVRTLDEGGQPLAGMQTYPSPLKKNSQPEQRNASFFADVCRETTPATLGHVGSAGAVRVLSR